MEYVIGGHVSASGGISQAVGRVHAIGGNALQFFSASPRIWKRMAIDPAEIERFKRAKQELGVKKSVIHAIYLLNLASENLELARKSCEVIEFDLRVDSLTEGAGVVVHLGSHLGRGFEAVKEQLVGLISQVLEATPSNSTFLIENSAGQNGKIASDLSEIKYLIETVGSPRLGWCLDTCHAYAAGCSLYQAQDHKDKGEENTQGELFKAKPRTNLLTEIDRLELWERLRVIHINDSRDPFDSGRDRHANLGEGEIGNEMMKSFLSHDKVRKLPLILEVPGIDGKSGPDKENIVRLKKLLE